MSGESTISTSLLEFVYLQESVPVRDLCGKHNPIGSSSLKLYSSQRTMAFSSESPSCSSFGFSFDHQYPNLMPTWLLFEGLDVNAKVKIARELARLIFGSRSSLVSMASSNFSSMQAHDHSADQDLRNKRSRDKQSYGYFERFAEAVTLNPHRVFLVEDVDQADYCSQIGIKRAIERGRITNPDGEEVSLCDAIVILSCQSFGSRSRACSFPPIQQSHNPDGAEDEKLSGIETNPSLSLDLNLSFDDDSSDKQSIDHVGLLESVDGLIIFKFQAL